MKGHKILILGILFMLTPCIVGGINCPAPCECDMVAGADCSNSSMTQLPITLDKDISILKANNNSFTHLNRFTFSKFGNSIFPHLIQLSFQNNCITNVDPSTFEGVRNIKELNLNKNLISQLNPSVFRNLHKLEKLHLDRNRFRVLEKGVFRELTSLSILDLSENMIDTIKYGAFKGLGSLKKLYLRANRLELLVGEIFMDLGSLVELDLSNNLLTIIKSDNFRGLWSLEVLEMIFNRIHTVERDSFIDLTNLNRLDLDDNLITSLKGRIFKGLSNLDTLYLSDNQLTHLGSDSFLGLRNLTTLYITSNLIETIESSTFQQTPNLEFLFLTSNPNLKLPVDEALIYSGTLFYLDMSECNLTYVPPAAFSGLSNLMTLELSKNNISRLDREVLKPMIERLSQVNIDNNPLQCDCHLKSTFIWCKDHDVSFFGKCDGKRQVTWESFSSLDCGEAMEDINSDNPDQEIETFTPVTFHTVVVIDDDVDPPSFPDQPTTSPRVANHDDKINKTSKSLERPKNEIVVSQHTVATSRVPHKENDRAWSVVLFLSITVCLLLIIIAGLLISLIFYRRQNRTIIYTVPM
ncbi:hypothetical protein L9F63_021706 [Diploptera punctata]|uniref:Uncharacterized protein n=1 Tax=Diploptera punctata TaxID=6984 RepID=A0AAD8EBR1_DIPPU|nr:hypothetical protein L9F63_021706 [Diploptera punctata]